jgi:homoserine kinase
VLSGSGPTLLAFCDDAASGETVAAAMAEAWRGQGVSVTARVVAPSATGARVVPA